MTIKSFIASVAFLFLLACLMVCTCKLYFSESGRIVQPPKQEQYKVISGTSENSLTTERVVDCMTLWTNRYICNPGLDYLKEYFDDEMAESIYEYEKDLDIEPGTVDIITPKLSNCHIIDNNTATIDYFESDIYAYRYTLRFNDEQKMYNFSFQNIIIS